MTNLRNPPKHFERAYKAALAMMELHEDLEPTSALKQAASDNGVQEGDDMQTFVEWANKRLFSKKREQVASRYIGVMHVLENAEDTSDEDLVDYIIETFEVERDKASNLVAKWNEFQSARREIA